MNTPRITMSTPNGPTGAPLAVLGPSLGSTASLWHPTEPLLHEAGFRTVTWDLPGHGASPSATEGFTLDDIAQAVLDSVSTLNETAFHYAGISIGGGVGLALGLRNDPRVLSNGIICAAAKFGTPEGWHERAETVRSIGTESLIEAAAPRWFAPDTIKNRPEMTTRMLNGLRDIDNEGYARCCEALAAFDVREQLGAIDAPTIAIWGEHDIVTVQEDSDFIASRVKDGRAVRIPFAGHLPSAEEPGALATTLTEFWRTVN